MGASKIWPRTELVTDQGRRICREHLESLPEALVSIHKDVQLKCRNAEKAEAISENPDLNDPCHSASIRSIDGITLTNWEMLLLIGTGNNDMIPDSSGKTLMQKFKIGDMPIIDSAVLEKYMNSICKYANRLRKKESPESEKAKEEKIAKGGKSTPETKKMDDDTAKVESSKRGSRSRSSSPRPKRPDAKGKTRERSPLDTSISCCFVPSAKFNDSYDYDSEEEIDDVRMKRRTVDTFSILDNLGLTRNRDGFMGLDYMFVPYDEGGDGEHYFLLGIAPKQKYLFVLESMNNKYSMADKPIKGIYLLALAQIPREQLDEDWPIYGRWTIKNDTFPDGSPQGVWQLDTYSKYSAPTQRP